MIEREIEKAINGKPFFINNKNTGKPERFDSIDYSEFLYYYKIWENYHYFGLPHSQGWYAEQDWLLEFLKSFENAHRRIEMFAEKMAMRNINNHG